MVYFLENPIIKMDDIWRYENPTIFSETSIFCNNKKNAPPKHGRFWPEKSWPDVFSPPAQVLSHRYRRHRGHGTSVSFSDDLRFAPPGRLKDLIFCYGFFVGKNWEKSMLFIRMCITMLLMDKKRCLDWENESMVGLSLSFLVGDFSWWFNRNDWLVVLGWFR